MAAPSVTPTATAIYARMPYPFRSYDVSNDWGCLRFISILADELDAATTLLDRLDWDWRNPNDVVSDLFNTTADDAWLTWIIERIGIRLPSAWDPALKRTAITQSAARLYRGTEAAIAYAVTDAYGTSASPTVYRHWRSDPWTTGVSTLLIGTPYTGVFITTWDDLQRTFFNWGDAMADAPTWSDLYTVDRIHLDVIAAVADEAPAGVQIFHFFDDSGASSGLWNSGTWNQGSWNS